MHVHAFPVQTYWDRTVTKDKNSDEGRVSWGRGGWGGHCNSAD